MVQMCSYCGVKPRYVEAGGRVHAYCGRTCANNAESNPGGVHDRPSQGHKSGSSNNNNRPRGLGDIIATEIAQKNKQAPAVSYKLVSSYKNNPIWRIEDTRGKSEISVVRDYQNEHIRVVFSLNDAESMGPDLPDEDEVGDTSEVDDEDQSLEDEGEAMQCTILVSKPHKGTLLIKAVALGGHFLIDNVSHSDDTDLATKNSAEADYQRQNIYIAPQFDDLSESLQNGFTSFLEERGINDELSEFVGEYVKHKENDEHTNWLQGLQSFFSP
ncbi:hypothetical protein SERLA73DRAFT_137483 [Serpula lacrymans var. lacrymans S7.3]|uniref:Mitochondrial glyco protein n=1 Tax=Serpula lacrymans var. lacrymans (strain S7.3) TaxID=936435 RepID=F8PZC1_SERL3|nr:hypothetical protein SERLA73DRAFT_137483 [Serpula lacrymans var. lacrymans S7.3]